MIGRILFIVFLLSIHCLVSPPLCTAKTALPADAFADLIWSAESESDILWFKVTPTGKLIVSTKEALLLLNPGDGEIVWSDLEFKELSEDYLEFLPFTRFAVISFEKNKDRAKEGAAVIDTDTGEVLWRTGKVGIEKCLGQFPLPYPGQMILYGRTGNDDPDVMVAAEIETGTEIWRNDHFFGDKKPELFTQRDDGRKFLRGNAPLFFDTDSTMIAFADKGGVRKFKARTGEAVWVSQFKVKQVPARKLGYAAFLPSPGKDIIYVPYDKTLQKISTVDGKTHWAEPPKLKGIVAQMKLVDHVLVVETGPKTGEDGNRHVGVLDSETGAPIWKDKFIKFKEATNCVVVDNTVFVVSKEKAYSVQLDNGMAIELAEDLEFDGGEIALGMEMREGGYLLRSSQNLMLLGADGAPQFHGYYSAPKAGLLSSIGKFVAVAIVNDAMQTSMSAGAFEFEFGMNLAEPEIMERLRASKITNDHVFILTELESPSEEKGPGLVKINKDTGTVERAVILGEKNPEYQLDEVDGHLYYKRGDKEIRCYEM